MYLSNDERRVSIDNVGFAKCKNRTCQNPKDIPRLKWDVEKLLKFSVVLEFTNNEQKKKINNKKNKIQFK